MTNQAFVNNDLQFKVKSAGAGLNSSAEFFFQGLDGQINWFAG